LVGRFPEESSDSCIGIFDRYANFLSWHCFFSGVVWASTGGAYGFERSKEIVRLFKRELTVYQRVLQDERTPRSAKLLRVLATGYFHLGYPESSVQPIVDEALGLTNDKSPYVYLS
jgi:hypothetical protein